MIKNIAAATLLIGGLLFAFLGEPSPTAAGTLCSVVAVVLLLAAEHNPVRKSGLAFLALSWVSFWGIAFGALLIIGDIIAPHVSERYARLNSWRKARAKAKKKAQFEDLLDELGLGGEFIEYLRQKGQAAGAGGGQGDANKGQQQQTP